MNSLHNQSLPTTLNFGSVSLTGFAVSALASYVMLQGMDAVFDMGHCPVEALPYRNVFLSHVHKDHVGALPLYLSLRDMQKMAPARVYVPAESRAGLLEMLRAFDAMEGPEVANREEMVVGVSPGDVLNLGRNTVRVFGVHHRVPSVGYTVVEQRSKLLPEFVGQDSSVVKAAKAAGHAVTSTVSRNLFTYVGDSTVQTLYEHPELGQSDVLMVEVTHYGDVAPEFSTNLGHTHLSQLVQLFSDVPESLGSPNVVLKHHSMRYSDVQLREMRASLPEGLRDRVSILANV